MDPKDMMLSEITQNHSQTHKDTYWMIPLMWEPWRGQAHRNRKRKGVARAGAGQGMVVVVYRG